MTDNCPNFGQGVLTQGPIPKTYSEKFSAEIRNIQLLLNGENYNILYQFREISFNTDYVQPLVQSRQFPNEKSINYFQIKMKIEISENPLEEEETAEDQLEEVNIQGDQLYLNVYILVKLRF